MAGRYFACLLASFIATCSFWWSPPTTYAQDSKDRKNVDPVATKHRQFDISLDARGAYLHKGELNSKDPRLPFYLGGTIGENAVRYVLPVIKGKAYAIEMTGPLVSPHLVLTDSNHGRIGNRTSYSGRAEMLYRAPSNGTIFIYASNEGGRLGPYELFIRGPVQLAKSMPAPAIPASPTAAGKVTHTGTKGFGDYLAGAVWSADAKSFVMLGQNGKIASYAVPSMERLQTGSLGTRFTKIGLSSQGLIVTPFGGDVWLVDPQDLTKVLKKIKTPGVTALAATPKSKFAVVNTAQGDLSVCVLDLEKGTIVTKQQNRSPLRLVMSADGKRVYNFANQQLTVSELSETGALAEIDASEPIFPQSQSVSLSPAGEFIAVPCNEGNQSVPDQPKIGDHTTYVFGTHDLAKPLFAVASGKYPRAIGIDPKSGFVIAQDHTHQVKLYSFKGELLSSQQIYPPGNTPMQYLVSPHGYDVLAVFPRHVEYLRLPASDKK